MPDPTPRRPRFKLALPEPLEVRLREEQERTGLARTEIIRAAVAEYLDRREKSPPSEANR